MTIAELVGRYLDERTGGWSPATLLSARKDLAIFTAFMEVSGRPGLRRDDVVAFVAHVRDHRTRAGRPWAPITQAGILGVLRRFLFWCSSSGHAFGDLGAWIDVRRETPLPRALAEKTVGQLVESGARGGRCELRDRAILELLYGTGLRARELLRLELHDVAFAEGTLRVSQGKGRKDRIVPFNDAVGEALQSYLRHERPVRPGGRLFLPWWGATELSYAALKQILARACRRAGIPRTSAHVLRHSYATHLLRGGASLVAIKMLLGHASIQSTEIYTDVAIVDLHRMVEQCHPRGRETRGERDSTSRKRPVESAVPHATVEPRT
jgi:site-specific recombinase XerD